jgi:hypothetical protein
MTPLDLWLPILSSAAAVFVLGSLVHMVFQFHSKDYSKLPGEERILAFMREEGVEPGDYMFPCAKSMKEFGTPEHQEKVKLGPMGTATINAGYSLGRSLALCFLFDLLISLFTAFVASLALAPGATALDVFAITAAVAILGHAFTSVQDSIWKGLSWCTTARFVCDGILYGLTTAGIFTWLWPGA